MHEWHQEWVCRWIDPSRWVLLLLPHQLCLLDQVCCQEEKILENILLNSITGKIHGLYIIHLQLTNEIT